MILFFFFAILKLVKSVYFLPRARLFLQYITYDNSLNAKLFCATAPRFFFARKEVKENKRLKTKKKNKANHDFSCVRELMRPRKNGLVMYVVSFQPKMEKFRPS